MEDTGYVVIFGGRSEIGVEVAKRLAPGRKVVLAARRADELVDEIAAVRAAGASEVHVQEFDADDIASHREVLMSIVRAHGTLWGTAVLAFGVLGDQERAAMDAAHAVAIVHTDFVAQVSLLTELLALLSLGPMRMVTFSSIAGVRVRRANYVYGSAKAGLDGFCSGFAQLAPGFGRHLLVVRPGFVIGRMTEGMEPAPFSSTPAQVADATVRALHGRRRSVWVPWQVGVIAAVFRILPGPIWRRLPR
ncbi:SDR family NAD(P)-dependent oxidoreductase [Mycolicibacterium bacteremicum]|uniref:Oxidoreductase n=1 Tax=Mycolicibacterium bacteremicum TaxID=564198 RepID=A0A1W9Z4Q9_MYCBA|nr:SDR family NAD(P)-dependent oxidoreductase [Mycolicibacterium bacteremicum]MCV7433824.1 SDR family NAD(P)-dependent oxidoreductase [Mycolicibacterium bacteremicum]ORA07152.1 oxidoreductase [Mycolicibacterium bacteremicum]